MANWKKVQEAFKQADQLTCGGLTAQGGVCAIGQLFLAAGFTRVEIELEGKTHTYPSMFNGLLASEYGLDHEDIDAVWNANDGTHTDWDGEQVLDYMIGWAAEGADNVADLSR